MSSHCASVGAKRAIAESGGTTAAAMMASVQSSGGHHQHGHQGRIEVKRHEAVDPPSLYRLRIVLNAVGRVGTRPVAS